MNNVEAIYINSRATAEMIVACYPFLEIEDYQHDWKNHWFLCDSNGAISMRSNIDFLHEYEVKTKLTHIHVCIATKR